MNSPKPVLKPGYYNSKPLIEVILLLKKTVGIQDACIQTNEVGIRYLEEQAIQAGNVEEFVRELCKKYSISYGTSDLKYFKSIQYKSYVFQTYNLIEPFFKSLNKSYRKYNNFNGVWKSKIEDKNLDPFTQLVENLPSELASLVKGYPEYYLLNYYRLVRNSIAHLQEDPEQHKKTSKYFEDFLSDKLEYFVENYEISAPNMPEDISFNDFMLYTRAVKYFSNILNDVCFPSISKLVEFAFAEEQLQTELMQTRRLNYQGALLNRINALRSFFHRHFNMHHKELRDEFCRAYLEKEGTDYGKYLR